MTTVPGQDSAPSDTAAYPNGTDQPGGRSDQDFGGAGETVGRSGQPAQRRRRARFRGARVSAVGPLKLFAARAVLFWEAAWPAIVPVAAPFFLFIVLSLFGVWGAAPALIHWAAIAATAGAMATAAHRGAGALKWPTRRAALARLEEDGVIRHAALQALEDTPFNERDADNPLWRAHMTAMRVQAAKARLRKPHADADGVDPFALRYAAAGLLVVALVAAGDERGVRMAEGFSPRAIGASGVSLADVWIEPPAYTGLAPIALLKAGDDLRGVRDQINAPQGSIVIAQINGAKSRRFGLSFKGGDGATQTASNETTPNETAANSGAAPKTGSTEATKAGRKTTAGALRQTVTLDQSGVLRLKLNGGETYWPVGVIKDAAPSVAFLETPSTTDDARLAVAVDLNDDYGITKASLTLRLDPDQERPLDAPALDAAALETERVVPLDGLAAAAGRAIGRARTGLSGERRVDLDLQSDPWAGLAVIGSLTVSDGAGQSASTAEERFRLPARVFFNPLAKSVIEQRQTLAVAADDWKIAGRAFDAVTFAPEAFFDDTTDYLLLRTAFRRVISKQGEDLAETVEEFWPLALQLEDEALELARRQLEAAEEALRQALERGASDEEINRLVENLRTAMNQYLQALAQSGQAPAADGQTAEQLEQGDLDEMLDSIRDLAQSGAENAARQALSELENILNNLRLSGQGQPGQQGQAGQGQPGQGQPGQGQPGQGASGQGGRGGAGEAGDLIGRQRDLSNRSFQEGQSGAPGAGGPLADEQRALSEDLSQLRDQLRGAAGRYDPDGDAAFAFDNAARAMERAERALENDNFDAAGTAMERAIANLRDGAETLAENAGREAREARRGQSGQGEGPATDPLGRPIGNALNGDGVDVPEELEYQRARDVLKELRKRLSDGERTEEEIDYLERLLERF